MTDVDIGTLRATLSIDGEQFELGLKKAEQQTESLKGKTDDLNTSAINLASGLYVAQQAYYYGEQALTSYTDATIRSYTAVRDFKAMTGATTEEAGKWQDTLEGLGMDLSAMTYAFRGLSNNMQAAIADPNGGAARAFKLLDVSVSDANGNMRDANAVMTEVLSALQKIPAGAERTSVGFDTIGKGVMNLNTLLDNGISINKLYANSISVTTDQGMRDFKDYTLAVNDFNSALEDLKVEIGAELLPALSGFVTWLNENFIPAIKDVKDYLGFKTYTGQLEMMLYEGQITREEFDQRNTMGSMRAMQAADKLQPVDWEKQYETGEEYMSREEIMKLPENADIAKRMGYDTGETTSLLGQEKALLTAENTAQMAWYKEHPFEPYISTITQPTIAPTGSVVAPIAPIAPQSAPITPEQPESIKVTVNEIAPIEIPIKPINPVEIPIKDVSPVEIPIETVETIKTTIERGDYEPSILAKEPIKPPIPKTTIFPEKTILPSESKGTTPFVESKPLISKLFSRPERLSPLPTESPPIISSVKPSVQPVLPLKKEVDTGYKQETGSGGMPITVISPSTVIKQPTTKKVESVTTSPATTKPPIEEVLKAPAEQIGTYLSDIKAFENSIRTKRAMGIDYSNDQAAMLKRVADAQVLITKTGSKEVRSIWADVLKNLDTPVKAIEALDKGIAKTMIDAKSATDAYTQSIKDLNKLKDDAIDLDRDYYENIQMAGRDVGKMRDLTIAWKRDKRDQAETFTEATVRTQQAGAAMADSGGSVSNDTWNVEVTASKDYPMDQIIKDLNAYQTAQQTAKGIRG